MPRFTAKRPAPVRHRDYLLRATGVDSDRLVNEQLIRFCAAFIDQGVAAWTLPTREQGFLHAWMSLYRDSHPVDHWLRELPGEIRRIEVAGLTPLEVIDESLEVLGVSSHERDEYLGQTLLGLPGWAGMLWQLETNAEWVVHPAPVGTLVEYVAVRLVLERLALASCAREALGEPVALAELRSRLRSRATHQEPMSVDQRAFMVFQLRRRSAGCRPTCFACPKRNGPCWWPRSKRFRAWSAGGSITWRSSAATATGCSTPPAPCALYPAH